jgi:hypothetical protein
VFDQILTIIRNSSILKLLGDGADEIFIPSPFVTKGFYIAHEIEVFLDYKKICLYIDNASVDVSKVYLWPKKDVVLLRGFIKDVNRTHTVKFYGQNGLVRGRIKICVDDEWIAGEKF